MASDLACHPQCLLVLLSRSIITFTLCDTVSGEEHMQNVFLVFPTTRRTELAFHTCLPFAAQLEVAPCVQLLLRFSTGSKYTVVTKLLSDDCILGNTLNTKVPFVTQLPFSPALKIISSSAVIANEGWVILSRVYTGMSRSWKTCVRWIDPISF